MSRNIPFILPVHTNSHSHQQCGRHPVVLYLHCNMGLVLPVLLFFWKEPFWWVGNSISLWFHQYQWSWALFHVFIVHFSSFREISVEVFCPFFNWMLCPFVKDWLVEIVYNSEYESFVGYIIGTIFYSVACPVIMLSFHEKSLTFWGSPIYQFIFRIWVFCDIFKELPPLKP